MDLDDATFFIFFYFFLFFFIFFYFFSYGAYSNSQIYPKKGGFSKSPKRLFFDEKFGQVLWTIGQVLWSPKKSKNRVSKKRLDSTDKPFLLRGNAPDVKKAKIAPLEALFTFPRSKKTRFFQRTLVYFRGRAVWRRF